MKKYILLLFPLTLSLISSSCQDSFEPKTSLDQKYVLYCIVKADSSAQIAVLSKTYDVEGFDPLSNTNDPSVKGAQVSLKINGVTYPMKDTAITRPDTSRYKGLLNAYITRAVRPASNQEIEITAVPENGITLTAKSKVPNGIIFSSSVNYMREAGTDVSLSWKATEPDLIYVPRFKIVYTRRSEIPAVMHSAEIPISIDASGTYHYPDISRSNGLFFNSDYIDLMMRKISEGQDKNDFRIIRLELEVLIYDQFLGNYLSSTTGFFDQLSIRLDEPNYTNINGGYGIFGSVMRDYFTIGVADSFLSAFGYNQ